ncbi:MAG: hypothetical protein B6I38_03420 [Anaerolineaceae bacterium 4572_5.1]|nr:MAG: hypothetical protein B6I38_03420 [Anaerolineaceae bacterium 4572_5.1]RLD07085.1 MAG: hypothetical protein DRI56_07160 [Chloroflexota bacterium]
MMTTNEIVAFLQAVPTFKGMSSEQLKALAEVCEVKTFSMGENIFRQGDVGGAMYIVVEGRVVLERELKNKNDTISMNEVKSHGYFGEISLFHEAPRSVTATVFTETKILRVDNDDFTAFLRQYPDLLVKLNQVLSERLLEAYDKISEMTQYKKPRELRKLYDKLDF